MHVCITLLRPSSLFSKQNIQPSRDQMMTDLEEEALVLEVFAAVGPDGETDVSAEAAELDRVRLQVHVRPQVGQHVIGGHVQLLRLGVLRDYGKLVSVV